MGAATYVIPIDVPPGTHGVQPQLSLDYNSQQKNGLLGLGWNIGGLSAITRCKARIVQDGYIGSINFDSNDRFCLDGTYLVAVQDGSGNWLTSTGTRAAAYGQEGTIYHTLNETWTKIVSHGTCGTGPCWFEAWNKDGTHLEF